MGLSKSVRNAMIPSTRMFDSRPVRASSQRNAVGGESQQPKVGKVKR